MNADLGTEVTKAAEFAGVRFLTPLLIRACEFLEHKRRDGAWGCFGDDPSSLYYTNLTLSALQAMYPDGSEQSAALQNQIASIELAAKSAFAERANSLDMNGLADFLGILLAVRAPDHDLIDRLQRRLVYLIKLQLDQPRSIVVRNLARALIALCSNSDCQELLNSCTQVLRNIENREGGWPGGSDGEASVIPTACVVEALRAIDRGGSADAIRRGEHFLELKVSDGGWQRIGTGADVFSQATALRVLAGHAPPDVIEAGIATLKAAANQDGWGSGPQQPSMIETTAMALLALAACGENRFVPFRIATNQLSDIRNKNQALEAELTSLRQAFNRQIAQESGAILADRDKLRSEARQQARKIADLEQELHDAQKEAFEQLRRSRELSHELLRSTLPSRELFKLKYFGAIQNATAGIATAVGVGIFLSKPSTMSVLGFGISTQFVALCFCLPVLFLFAFKGEMYQRMISYFVFIACGIAGILVYLAEPKITLSFFGFNLPMQIIALLVGELALTTGVVLLVNDFIYRRSELWRVRNIEVQFDDEAGPVTSMVSKYYDIVSMMPASLRDEINYLFLSRVVDMPKDVGFRYTRDLLDRFEVPILPKDRILAWATDFLELDTFSRRAVSEQIRRIQLR